VIWLGETRLTLDDVLEVARGEAHVELSAEARKRVRASRSLVDRAVTEGRVIYGITTGFGSLAATVIPPERTAELQVALVRSHATGMGDTVEPEVVRAMLLLRARSREARADPSTRRLADFVALMPEGLAIVDGRGCVLLANPALVQMCRHGGDELSLVGRRLPDLLGDPQQRLDGLLEDARRQGSISGVPATLGSTGQPLTVEVSAARLAHGGPDSVGLIVHRRAALARPLPDAAADADGGHDGLDSLVAQLGRVSLPELVQEATHLAERRLIRAAMHRAPGDLAAAADWLGIAPDSLRLRLQRHGLPLGQAADGGPSTLLN
jgi:PAS domain-containing protein/DNA-binding protein Fis